jgi:hypothetical protein
MRYPTGSFNFTGPAEVGKGGTVRSVRLLALLLIGGGAMLLVGQACSRVGDDRFQKLPDAPPVDAIDVTPDAGGPGDALPGGDAGLDAAPDAP